VPRPDLSPLAKCSLYGVRRRRQPTALEVFFPATGFLVKHCRLTFWSFYRAIWSRRPLDGDLGHCFFFQGVLKSPRPDLAGSLDACSFSFLSVLASFVNRAGFCFRPRSYFAERSRKGPRVPPYRHTRAVTRGETPLGGLLAVFRELEETLF